MVYQPVALAWTQMGMRSNHGRCVKNFPCNRLQFRKVIHIMPMPPPSSTTYGWPPLPCLYSREGVDCPQYDYRHNSQCTGKLPNASVPVSRRNPIHPASHPVSLLRLKVSLHAVHSFFVEACPVCTVQCPLPTQKDNRTQDLEYGWPGWGLEVTLSNPIPL
jgi:hypothetical protein